MCGIAGWVSTSPTRADELEAWGWEMAALLAHRGPDDVGVWADGPNGVVLAHRRLSIVDLSPAGHQPMWDAEGEVGVVYNGEIFNFRELRSELEGRGIRFRSRSDTEVLLYAYRTWGTKMLSRLNGMFALALWDRRCGELLLARDPIGIKPLYYAETAEGVGFASELKALLCLPAVSREPDIDALRAYLTLLWAPAPRTPLREVRKLLPGEAVRIRAGRILQRWRYVAPAFATPVEPLPVDEAVTQLRACIRAAVERQMVADVPVGAFLSGGLDSSTVVCFARDFAPGGQLDCVTIASRGGEEKGTVEDLPYAEQVARALGVRLHTIWVGPELAERVEEMVWHLDEPQPDPACLNVLLIAEHARALGIPVLLSGAGGDDLLTGYRRHVVWAFARYVQMLPRGVRRFFAERAARLDQRIPLFRRFARLLAAIGSNEREQLIEYFFWIRPDSADALFHPDVRRAFTVASVGTWLEETLAELPPGTPRLHRMLHLEMRHFLADHNLNYTDKMAMARGVEVRVPLLDLEVVSLAARLPPEYKQRGRTGKWILRRAMKGLLPQTVLTRPKTGFGAPLRRWIRCELRPLIDDLLNVDAVRRRGWFDGAALRALVEADRAGRVDAAYTIFGLVCLELWAQRFLDRARVRSA